MEALKRSHWFRPWQWSRWARWTVGIVGVLSPIIYLLSAVPVTFMWIRFFSDPVPEPYGELFYGVYAPAEWCGENFSVMEAIYDWEWKFMIETFGPPTDSRGFH